MTHIRALALAAIAAMGLSACSTDQAIDNSVGLVAGTTKVVAKGTVAAGKGIYRGGQAVFGRDAAE